MGEDTEGLDWGAKRLGKFTASEVWRLVGKGTKKYWKDGAETYIDEKVAELLTGEWKSSPDTMATAWGVENEPQAAKAFTMVTGIELDLCGFIPMPDHPDSAGATPDRLLPNNSGVIEIKCPYVSANHIEYMRIKSAGDMCDIVPKYYWQMVMQMICTQTSMGYFISFDPRIKYRCLLHYAEIIPPAEDFEMLKDKITEAIKERDERLKYALEYGLNPR